MGVERSGHSNVEGTSKITSYRLGVFRSDMLTIGPSRKVGQNQGLFAV